MVSQTVVEIAFLAATAAAFVGFVNNNTPLLLGGVVLAPILGAYHPR